MLDLHGKVALVMGCGSVAEGWGNGRATAVLFARQGARVYGTDVNLDNAKATLKAMEAEARDASATAHVAACDVTKARDVESVVADCLARFGRIDILVNNVGLSQPGGPVDMSEEVWDQQMQVNLKGAFLACKHVIPIMQRQGGGAVVNVSSVAGLRYIGKPQVAYAAAKAGLLQFTRTTAMIHAQQNIRLNCVVPGLMHTPTVSPPNIGAATPPASWPIVMRKRRWDGWATVGTWPMLYFSWRRMRAATSPEPNLSSTAVWSRRHADARKSDKKF